MKDNNDPVILPRVYYIGMSFITVSQIVTIIVAWDTQHKISKAIIKLKETFEYNQTSFIP